MENYSFETVEFMRYLAGDRDQAQRDVAACQRILDARCPAGDRLTGFPTELRLHVIELNFEQFSDPEERRFFLTLPTTFSLTDHQVDCLIAAGRRLLRTSQEYRDLLGELGGELQPGAEMATEFPSRGCKASN
jgi:NTE family protein